MATMNGSHDEHQRSTAWLKPFKFAISTAIYSLTLAWIFEWLSDWPRARRVVGWTTAIVVRAGGGDYRHAGLARNDKPFQRVDAARCDAVSGHGRRDRDTDAGERRRAVALWRQRFIEQSLDGPSVSA